MEEARGAEVREMGWKTSVWAASMQIPLTERKSATILPNKTRSERINQFPTKFIPE